MSAAIAPNPNDPQAPLGMPARPWWIGYIRQLHLDIPLAVESGGTGKADALNLSDLGAYKATIRTTAAAITAQENTIYRLIGRGARTVKLPSSESVKTGAEVEVFIESPTIHDVTITPVQVDNLISQGGDGDYVFTGRGKSVRIVRVAQYQWNVIEPDVSLTAADIAETSTLKILTATERTKLTGIAEGANNYTHPATHPQSMIEGLADALAGKAPLASPALTGTPTAPTAAKGTNTTQLATTAFVLESKTMTFTNFTVQSNISAVANNIYGILTAASGSVITLPTAANYTYQIGEEIIVIVGSNGLTVATIQSGDYIIKASGVHPKNTPFNLSLSGTTIAFRRASQNAWLMLYPEYELTLKAPLASPALTGTPTAPTAAAANNTTQIATTAFVQAKAAGQLLTSGTMTETSTGSPGMIRYDSGKLYVCVATDTWIFFEKGTWA